MGKNMKSVGRIIRVGMLIGVLSGPTDLLAQNPSGAPVPAARVYLPVGGLSDDQDPNTSRDLLPDDRPLTGAQIPTVGSTSLRHSYWVPGFEYGNLARSASFQNPTATDWISTSYVSGNLSLLQAWPHAQFDLDYSGGGFFSTDSVVGNGQYHQLGLVQQFDWRRWQLAFLDQFADLPEAQFGFGSGTNLGLPGIGGSPGGALPSLQGSYVPNQSIYTAVGPRYSNAFVTQIGYRTSPRSSLTLVGSSGILHFTESGNIDTNDVIASAGYNYEVSRNSTIGVLYRFSAYHFVGQPQAIGDHAVQFAYGRKITGRIALQLFGGPEITQLRVPIGTSDQYISGSGAANLIYTVTERTDLSTGYTHGVSGGSGVFSGAISDQVQGSLVHQMSRQWRGAIQFGYSRNGPISQSGAQNSPRYSSWFGGANLQKALGRSARISLAYTAYLENSSVAAPSAGYTQHQVALEIGWHTLPFVIH